MTAASIKDEIEKFLYREADHLDNWRLSEWEALLTEDAEYLVPPIGVRNAEEMTSDTALFIIADDRAMIAARVHRLLGNTAFCEKPRSNVRHLMGNIQVLSDTGGMIEAVSNFCVYRIRRSEITQYVGHFHHRLIRDGDSFKIRRKTVVLDLDMLRGQGGLGIIL